MSLTAVRLVALKCDLQHFTKSHSPALVADAIRERIRQAKAQLARPAATNN